MKKTIAQRIAPRDQFFLQEREAHIRRKITDWSLPDNKFVELVNELKTIRNELKQLQNGKT